MSKKNNAKKKGKAGKAGKAAAVFVALVLIAGSACVVSYLVRRGQNAISNYTTVPTAATEGADSHSVTDCITDTNIQKIQEANHYEYY